MNNFNAQIVDFQHVLTNPILDIAARVWEPDRYAAFKTCYSSMRVVDDLVDNAKISGVNDEIKELLVSQVDEWLTALDSNKPTNELQEQLLQELTKFKIPLWPWRELSKSMVFDLHNSGFKTFQQFLDYSEGASVAPGSVFMHLCGITRNNERDFNAPKFNVREAARPIALFAYLVHIMRDFQKDQLEGLNYFADDLIEKHGLTNNDLSEATKTRVFSEELRALMREYYSFANDYRVKARKSIDALELEPRYELSLNLIFELYSQVFEKVNVDKGTFTTEELNPSPTEVNERIKRTIVSFEDSSFK